MKEICKQHMQMEINDTFRSSCNSRSQSSPKYWKQSYSPKTIQACLTWLIEDFLSPSNPSNDPVVQQLQQYNLLCFAAVAASRGLASFYSGFATGCQYSCFDVIWKAPWFLDDVTIWHGSHWPHFGYAAGRPWSPTSYCVGCFGVNWFTIFTDI